MGAFLAVHVDVREQPNGSSSVANIKSTNDALHHLFELLARRFIALERSRVGQSCGSDLPAAEDVSTPPLSRTATPAAMAAALPADDVVLFETPFLAPLRFRTALEVRGIRAAVEGCATEEQSVLRVVLSDLLDFDEDTNRCRSSMNSGGGIPVAEDDGSGAAPSALHAYDLVEMPSSDGGGGLVTALTLRQVMTHLALWTFVAARAKRQFTLAPVDCGAPSPSLAFLSIADTTVPWVAVAGAAAAHSLLCCELRCVADGALSLLPLRGAPPPPGPIDAMHRALHRLLVEWDAEGAHVSVDKVDHGGDAASAESAKGLRQRLEKFVSGAEWGSYREVLQVLHEPLALLSSSPGSLHRQRRRRHLHRGSAQVEEKGLLWGAPGSPPREFAAATDDPGLFTLGHSSPDVAGFADMRLDDNDIGTRTHLPGGAGSVDEASPAEITQALRAQVRGGDLRDGEGGADAPSTATGTGAGGAAARAAPRRRRSTIHCLSQLPSTATTAGRDALRGEPPGVAERLAADLRRIERELHPCTHSSDSDEERAGTPELFIDRKAAEAAAKEVDDRRQRALLREGEAAPDNDEKAFRIRQQQLAARPRVPLPPPAPHASVRSPWSPRTCSAPCLGGEREDARRMERGLAAVRANHALRAAFLLTIEELTAELFFEWRRSSSGATVAADANAGAGAVGERVVIDAVVARQAVAEARRLLGPLAVSVDGRRDASGAFAVFIDVSPRHVDIEASALTLKTGSDGGELVVQLVDGGTHFRAAVQLPTRLPPRLRAGPPSTKAVGHRRSSATDVTCQNASLRTLLLECLVPRGASAGALLLDATPSPGCRFFEEDDGHRAETAVCPQQLRAAQAGVAERADAAEASLPPGNTARRAAPDVQPSLTLRERWEKEQRTARAVVENEVARGRLAAEMRRADLQQFRRSLRARDEPSLAPGDAAGEEQSQQQHHETAGEEVEAHDIDEDHIRDDARNNAIRAFYTTKWTPELLSTMFAENRGRERFASARGGGGGSSSRRSSVSGTSGTATPSRHPRHSTVSAPTECFARRMKQRVPQRSASTTASSHPQALPSSASSRRRSTSSSKRGARGKREGQSATRAGYHNMGPQAEPAAAVAAAAAPPLLPLGGPGALRWLLAPTQHGESTGQPFLPRILVVSSDSSELLRIIALHDAMRVFDRATSSELSAGLEDVVEEDEMAISALLRCTTTSRVVVQPAWIDALTPPLSAPRALFALTSLLSCDLHSKPTRRRFLRAGGVAVAVSCIADSRNALMLRLKAARLLLLVSDDADIAAELQRHDALGVVVGEVYEMLAPSAVLSTAPAFQLVVLLLLLAASLLLASPGARAAVLSGATSQQRTLSQLVRVIARLLFALTSPLPVDDVAVLAGVDHAQRRRMVVACSVAAHALVLERVCDDQRGAKQPPPPPPTAIAALLEGVVGSTPAARGSVRRPQQVCSAHSLLDALVCALKWATGAPWRTDAADASCVALLCTHIAYVAPAVAAAGVGGTCFCGLDRTLLHTLSLLLCSGGHSSPDRPIHTPSSTAAAVKTPVPAPPRARLLGERSSGTPPPRRPPSARGRRLTMNCRNSCGCGEAAANAPGDAEGCGPSVAVFDSPAGAQLLLSLSLCAEAVLPLLAAGTADATASCGDIQSKKSVAYHATLYSVRSPVQLIAHQQSTCGSTMIGKQDAAAAAGGAAAAPHGSTIDAATAVIRCLVGVISTALCDVLPAMTRDDHVSLPTLFSPITTDLLMSLQPSLPQGDENWSDARSGLASAAPVARGVESPESTPQSPALTVQLATAPRGRSTSSCGILAAPDLASPSSVASVSRVAVPVSFHDPYASLQEIGPTLLLVCRCLAGIRAAVLPDAPSSGAAAATAAATVARAVVPAAPIFLHLISIDDLLFPRTAMATSDIAETRGMGSCLSRIIVEIRTQAAAIIRAIATHADSMAVVDQHDGLSMILRCLQTTAAAELAAHCAGAVAELSRHRMLLQSPQVLHIMCNLLARSDAGLQRQAMNAFSNMITDTQSADRVAAALSGYFEALTALLGDGDLNLVASACRLISLLTVDTSRLRIFVDLGATERLRTIFDKASMRHRTVRTYALAALSSICAEDHSLSMIVGRPALPATIRYLMHALALKDPLVFERCIALLATVRVARSEAVCKELLRHGAVPILIRLIGNTVGRVQDLAATALGTLRHHRDVGYSSGASTEHRPSHASLYGLNSEYQLV